MQEFADFLGSQQTLVTPDPGHAAAGQARTKPVRSSSNFLNLKRVDRLAIMGTPERARDQLVALWNGGASRVVLIPAIPDPRAALDSLARLLG